MMKKFHKGKHTNELLVLVGRAGAEHRTHDCGGGGHRGKVPYHRVKGPDW